MRFQKIKRLKLFYVEKQCKSKCLVAELKKDLFTISRLCVNFLQPCGNIGGHSWVFEAYEKSLLNYSESICNIK